MKQPKTQANNAKRQRRFAPVTGSAYWVIDTETLGEHEKSRTAFGPFGSVADAENWLRKDAEETFLAADKSLRDVAESKGWAAPVLIVEVKKTVVACPTVKVTVKLNTPNDQIQPPRK